MGERVWVVVNWSGVIGGVYSSEVDAQLRAMEAGEDYRVKTCVLGVDVDLSEAPYRVRMNRSGDKGEAWKVERIEYRHWTYFYWDGEAMLDLWAHSEEEALEMGDERRKIALENRAWPSGG